MQTETSVSFQNSLPLPQILTPNDAIKHLTSSTLQTPRSLSGLKVKSHSSTSLREDSRKAQLSAKMEMIQKSYWSLKGEDAVCDSVKTMKAHQAKSGKAGSLPMINDEGTDELVLKEQELEGPSATTRSSGARCKRCAITIRRRWSSRRGRRSRTRRI